MPVQESCGVRCAAVPACVCVSRDRDTGETHKRPSAAPQLLPLYPYILPYPTLPQLPSFADLVKKKMKKMKKRKRKRDANAGMLREYGNKKWREVIRVSENRSSKAIAEGSEIIARSGSAEG